MKKTMQEHVLKELVLLAFFAAAFGYVEGAVAHYLRLHYYPSGFEFRLSDLGSHNTLAVEMGREAATLIMLVSVAALTKGPFLRRFANFVYVFAIWDLGYYCALYLFEKWPQNLLAWDVLFLLPVPWFAPVLAPVVISILGIAGAVIVNMSFAQTRELKMSILEPLLICAAIVLWMVSFMNYPQRNTFPAGYNGFLLAAGVISVMTAYGIMVKKNLRRKENEQ